MDVRADPPFQEWPPLGITTQPPNPGGRPENQGPGEIGLMRLRVKTVIGSDLAILVTRLAYSAEDILARG